MGLFEKLMKRMVEYYAKERGGVGWSPFGGTHRGYNRHHKVSAIDLIVSVSLKRPSQKRSSTCAPTKPTTPPT